ncbi:MAG: hypothetical protein N3E40_02340 [Dehalococcoidia bacterium]|nr:hypothetical protein [Dehalococcoidia bacterium]
MKIGFFEVRSDRFINDVISRLGEFETEIISLSAQPVPICGNYRVVVDRLSFRFPYLREVVKSYALEGTYVINNPFSSVLTNKLVDAKLATGLGIPVPRTVVLPRLDGYEETEGAVREIDWDRVVEGVSFPCIIKPYDGYAWDDVYVVNSVVDLRKMYESLTSRPVMLLQQMVRYREYYRVFCIDRKDILFAPWIPRPLGMGEFPLSGLKPSERLVEQLSTMTIRLNDALDLDVNAVEWCLDEEGRPWLIDAFNEVPDIRQDNMPAAYYNWLVEHFAACVREKAGSGVRNRTVFGVSQ